MWDGRDVVIICGGPSARGQPLARIAGRDAYVIGINRCAEELPFCDAVFTVDGWWCHERAEFLRTWPGRKILCVGAQEVPDGTENYERPVLIRGIGISTDERACYEGGNSGFACTSLAAARHAKRIIFVGLDLNVAGHWHEGYSWKSRFNERCYPTWAKAFDQLAPMVRARGIGAVNVNPGSAVRGFPFASFDEVFPP